MRNLARAQRFLGIAWHGVKVWRPSKDDLENLDYCRQLQDASFVRDFFKTLQPCHGVVDFTEDGKPVQREENLLSAFQELLRAQADLRRDPNNPLVQAKSQAAFDKYTAQVDAAVFSPLAEAGLKSDDPASRARRLQLAHVARLFHRRVPVAYATQEKLAPGEGLVSEADLRQMERLGNMILRLTQEEERPAKAGRAYGGFPRLYKKHG